MDNRMDLVAKKTKKLIILLNWIRIGDFFFSNSKQAKKKKNGLGVCMFKVS